MRYLYLFFNILLFIAFMSSCATGPIVLPEKYSLERQLEPISEIYKYRVMDWEKVDPQSLILRTGPSDYCLLVLNIPSVELMFTERILITTTSSMIRVGIDKVIVYGAGGIRESYLIDRIYRIKDYQQKLLIKEQLENDRVEDDNDTQRGVIGVSI